MYVHSHKSIYLFVLVLRTDSGSPEIITVITIIHTSIHSLCHVRSTLALHQIQLQNLRKMKKIQGSALLLKP